MTDCWSTLETITGAAESSRDRLRQSPTPVGVQLSSLCPQRCSSSENGRQVNVSYQSDHMCSPVHHLIQLNSMQVYHTKNTTVVE